MVYMNLRKLSVILFTFLISCQVSAGSIQLESDKERFAPAEEVTVSFQVDEAQVDRETWWIGVFKKGEADLRSYLAFAYLSEAVDNKVQLTLPIDAGEYELKLATDAYDQEKASSIVVIVEAIDKTKILLQLQKKIVKPDSIFTVKFKSQSALSLNAWVGLFSDKVKHGSRTGHEGYVYTLNKSTLTFTSPRTLGSYELRFFDADPGNEVLSVPFEVGFESALSGAITLARDNFEPAQPIITDYTASNELPKSSWIGLFSPGKKDKEFLDYIYLNDLTSGKLSFITPSKKGIYEFRLYSHEGGTVLAKQFFNVTSDLDGEKIRRELDELGRVSFYGISFDTDKSKIKAESEPTLQLLGALLVNNPELKLEIQGHTDNVGDDEYNLGLSEERALSVKRYLLDEIGIDQARLTAKGYGETLFKHSNDFAEGRAKNRRVDIIQLR